MQSKFFITESARSHWTASPVSHARLAIDTKIQLLSIMPEFFDRGGEISKTRQNLPHWQQSEAWVFVTWRLADSVPTEKLLKWKEEIAIWRAHHPEPWDNATSTEFRNRFTIPFDTWLDQGHGSCLLAEPENRNIVATALHHFHDQRYNLGSYVIMPNHVHVLFSIIEPHKLPDILKSWKRHTSREINIRNSTTGTKLWQPDYFDRLIRSPEHLHRVIAYIARNPNTLPKNTFTLYKT